MAAKKAPPGVREYLAEIGRKGGRVKGPKGFSSMSPDRRAEIARKAAEKRWGKKKVARKGTAGGALLLLGFMGLQSARGATPAPSAADNWEKAKDCSARAEQMMATWSQTRAGGQVPSDWNNHYSPKYNRCFVLVYYLEETLYKGGHRLSKILFDAYERAPALAAYSDAPLCNATCSDDVRAVSEQADHCSVEGKEAACEQAQFFISDHMKN